MTWFHRFKTTFLYNTLLAFFIVSCILSFFIILLKIALYLNYLSEDEDEDEYADRQNLESLPPEVDELPALAFSEDTTKLAGTDPVCVFCLLEFVDGDLVTVLPKCNHGFHHECIQGWWWTSHSSCPVCRAVCWSPPRLEKSPSSSPENIVPELDV